MIRVAWEAKYMAYLVWNYDERDGQRIYQDAYGNSHKVKVGSEAPFWLMLDPDEARDLANKLFNAGVQPNQALYNEGELRATKKHLEDMRSIAMLNPPKVGLV
jgi:hypothetical protein